jgi:hypothetical protein
MSPEEMRWGTFQNGFLRIEIFSVSIKKNRKSIGWVFEKLSPSFKGSHRESGYNILGWLKYHCF